MKNGQQVAAFERAFAEYVGAKYAIALCNGTATLHTALVALGVKPGDRVAVPPLTMSATTMAVLHAGAVPVFVDVDPQTWLMEEPFVPFNGFAIPVSLYGLHHPGFENDRDVDDAAQTLRPNNRAVSFTSYSFQSSKILALGEGGMLVTNDEALATKAREFSSLGYRMRADQPRIDPDALKSPTFDRHYSVGFNYRMNDLTAAAGLRAMERASVEIRDDIVPGIRIPVARVEFDNGLDALKATRRFAAKAYRNAIDGCDWLTPQYVPEGWTHDYWTFAVACDTPERALRLSDAVVKHGGERAYPAWRLTYQEPAFLKLGIEQAIATDSASFSTAGAWDLCPVAESLQPRLVQFQTNDIASAERNAAALRRAIADLSDDPLSLRSYTLGASATHRATNG